MIPLTTPPSFSKSPTENTTSSSSSQVDQSAHNKKIAPSKDYQERLKVLVTTFLNHISNDSELPSELPENIREKSAYKQLFEVVASSNKGKKEVTEVTDSPPLSSEKALCCFSEIVWAAAKFYKENKNEKAPLKARVKIGDLGEERAHHLSLMRNAILALTESLNACFFESSVNRCNELCSFTIPCIQELLEAGDLYGADRALYHFLMASDGDKAINDLTRELIQRYVSCGEFDRASAFCEDLGFSMEDPFQEEMLTTIENARSSDLHLKDDKKPLDSSSNSSPIALSAPLDRARKDIEAGHFKLAYLNMELAKNSEEKELLLIRLLREMTKAGLFLEATETFEKYEFLIEKNIEYRDSKELEEIFNFTKFSAKEIRKKVFDSLFALNMTRITEYACGQLLTPPKPPKDWDSISSGLESIQHMSPNEVVKALEEQTLEYNKNIEYLQFMEQMHLIAADFTQKPRSYHELTRDLSER